MNDELINRIFKDDLFLIVSLLLRINVLSQLEKNKIIPSSILVLAPSITPKRIEAKMGMVEKNFILTELAFNPNNNPPIKFEG